MNAKLRFGIIGCSRGAIKNVIPSIISADNAEVSMIGSRSPEKAKEVAEKFGVSRFGTYDEVLKNLVADLALQTPR